MTSPFFCLRLPRRPPRLPSFGQAGPAAPDRHSCAQMAADQHEGRLHTCANTGRHYLGHTRKQQGGGEKAGSGTTKFKP